MLEKALAKAFPNVELLYPTGPVAVLGSDLPVHEGSLPTPEAAPVECWGWWRARDPRGEYFGLEQSLECISDLLHRSGPIDGVIGFSQGAAAAAMVAALLEPGRRKAFATAQENNGDCLSFPDAFARFEHPPLRFAICYSGFASEYPSYAAFYTPPIATPSLHFIGSLDTVVEEGWTRGLVAQCESGTVSVALHPGGHFVPSGKRELSVLVDFIYNALSREKYQTEDLAPGISDEDVLAMDVPF